MDRGSEAALSWNDRVIKEFRDNDGRVGGSFEGAPLLLLTTAGRRTGRPHTNPVVYAQDGERYLVFASNAGRDRHPDWYYNLLDSPQVTVEIGTGEGQVTPIATRAVPLEGEARDRAWERQRALAPAFGEYEKKTTRTIPVVALYPLDLSGDPERSRMIAERLTALHDGLRADLARIRTRIAEIGDGGPRAEVRPDLVEQLRRHCLTYCYDLRMHHTREDGSFTAFERRFPSLAPAITRLRDEHRVVEKRLGDFEAFLGREHPDVEKVRAELDRVVADLEAHFSYEEEQLLAAAEGRPSPRGQG